MSDILIRDMEMPTNTDMAPTAVWVYSNGYAVVFKDNGKMQQYTQAFPVPPHGDLVDLKAPFKAQYYDEMTEEWLEKIVTVEDVLYGCMVDEMPPTIIPAEEGE